MQFKWLQIFCLCAAIQFQFIEGFQYRPTHDQPIQGPGTGSYVMNNNHHQPIHASYQPIQGPGTGSYAKNNNHHQFNPAPDTNAGKPLSYRPEEEINNSNNNQHQQQIEAVPFPDNQGATNNQGFAPASDTSSSIVPGHIPEEESNNFNHNHDQTQQQHIETTTYPYSSQGSNNQGFAPASDTSSSIVPGHRPEEESNNFNHNHDQSPPKNHICTKTTEHYDCQIRDVRLTKKGERMDFGLQHHNPQQRLTFADSTLEYLPKSLIDAFRDVILLNLNDLKIESIEPNAFEHAAKLVTVYLEKNRLDKIDSDAFRGANNLQILVLSKNEITQIDNQAFDSNTGLQYLYLDRNQLDKLPSFEKTARLQFLNASYNNLASIDDGHFRQLGYLQTLDLSYNRLGRLNLQQLNAYPLELVDVSSNDLTDFVMPTYVITLNARNNSLREFAVGQQCTLRNVDLSRNKLETQPKFKNCGSIEHLDLSHNLLEEFVYNESMEKLQTINLAHNNLFDIQLKIKTKSFASSLKKLDLSHNRLTHISSLDAFKKLEWLLLNNNKLITFNKVFQSFPKAIQMAMANNEWNCGDIKYFESKTKDKHNNQCAQGQENIKGICCRAYSKPYNDRLNEVLREAVLHERENQKKCSKPVSASNNQNTNLDEIRNAMANADTGRKNKLEEIGAVKTNQTNLNAALQGFRNKLNRLTNSKVDVAQEIERQRKSHRVIKEGLISDQQMLTRIIQFVQERDAFNKDLLSRRKEDTEESKKLLDEKKREFYELKQTIEKQKNEIISLKKEEKDNKKRKDFLEKQWNKNSASIHGSSGTIS